MAGSGPRSTADGGDGGKAVSRPYGSSSTVPQIGSFKAQKHHLSIEKVSVGYVLAEEARKYVGTMEVVGGCWLAAGKSSFSTTSLHGMGWG